jgi:glucose/arabinose dehydrogenase
MPNNRSALTATCAVVALTAAPISGWAQLPPGFVAEVVADVDFPLYHLDWAPDGRVFMTGWQGEVFVADADWTVASEPVITFSVRTDHSEAGLQGIAVDPRFDLNHHLFVYYASDDPSVNRVERFTEVDGTGTDVVSVLEMVDPDPAAHFHNAGTMQFGSDGNLYLSVGDGGTMTNSSFSAQSDSFFFGKILRLPVHVPLPLPTESPVQFFHCRGLRNSFGWDFHPTSGLIYALDNGVATDDELNRIVPGGNFGWPEVIGTGGEPEFSDPIHVYADSIGVAGLRFIRGPRYPTHLQGDLVFVSFTDRSLHHLVLGGENLDQILADEVWLDGGFFTDVIPVNMFFGPDDLIYITALVFNGPAPQGARVYRLIPPSAGMSGLTVN